MADNLNDAGARDRGRINVHEDYELRHWTQALGVDEATLRGAIQAVGDNAEDVRGYLKTR